ncbi:MAG: signal peptidase II [Synechococcus sp. MED850]|jgi:signal peptidase II|nr:signal peptidase II [Synechococcus sp. MED850]OUW98442.1 MAG: signal peptidase II [Cyanobacteria bacterium TMED229]
MNQRLTGRSTVLVLASSVLVIDQTSKLWMTSSLSGGRTINAVPGLLDLHLVHNSGAAFSLLTGSTLLLSLLSLVVAVIVLIWLWRQRRLAFWQALAVGFLLGGTIGNGLDRWRLGYVIDFLALVPIDFPIFNVADVAINLAVLCFALDLLKSRESSRRG